MKHIIEQALSQMTETERQQIMDVFTNPRMVQTMNELKNILTSETEDLSIPKIECRWNVSITNHKDMEPKTIYLDGSCRGFAVRHDIGSISFDHHTGCQRSITYATCTQVLHALLQGMDVTDFDQVVIDDIDADTVMAVWLIENSGRIQEPAVQQLVREIGYVDAHFTVGFELNPLHKHINPLYHVEKTEELLNSCLEHVDSYLATGSDASILPELDEDERLTTCYGFIKAGEDVWAYDVKVRNTNFEKMYKKYDLVLAVQPLENGTMYTIGKKSEFVMMCNFADLFEDLCSLETKHCLENNVKFPSKNWGGSTTIGGSARYEDQAQGSYLDVDVVIATIIDTIGENV